MERLEVVELIDGAGNPPEKFLRAVRVLKELVTKNPPTLVHCHAGQSRSAAVVCKYFMKEEGNGLAEAMKRIASKRRAAIIAGLQDALASRQCCHVASVRAGRTISAEECFAECFQTFKSNV